MAHASTERKLSEVSARLRKMRTELGLADEHLAHAADIADDTRLRSLVSETPLSAREFREADRQLTTMRRERERIIEEIADLERRQDELLDRLIDGR